MLNTFCTANKSCKLIYQQTFFGTLARSKYILFVFCYSNWDSRQNKWFIALIRNTIGVTKLLLAA